MLLIQSVVIALFIYVALALVLVVSQSQASPQGAGLDFSRQIHQSDGQSDLLRFTASDGAQLAYRQYGTDTEVTLIVLHGSSAHGGLYEELATGMSAFAKVIVPDLRGHGESVPGGDISYIGQLEDDLADLIKSIRENSTQKLLLVGHSSGGGLAVRYAGNQQLPQPDGVLLLAPYLGYNAPTTRPGSGGWAMPLTRRIIGLSMLNTIGIRFLNSLPVISFRVPDNAEALAMTPAYSFRLNTSFAPRRDFNKDLSALPDFAVLIGDKDEAFIAAEYAPLVQQFKQGEVQVFKGLSHLDVIGDPQVHGAIRKFIASL